MKEFLLVRSALYYCQPHLHLTLRRYLSTISRPQEVHTVFPCREPTVRMEAEEDEEREDGEYESSSKISSGPEEPCQKQNVRQCHHT